MQKILLTTTLALFILQTACSTPQSRYETTTQELHIQKAPIGTPKIKVALINFRDLSGKKYLVEPATAQLTGMLIQSGYFEVIEPSLVESVIQNQGAVTPEKLKTLSEQYAAEYFLTGTLTNFEIRETQSGFCLLFGLLGSYQKKEYIVEAGIDYRLVKIPEAKITLANNVSSKRVDTSQLGGLFLAAGGSEVKVKQTSGGKLLRHALHDLLRQLTAELSKD